MKRIFTIERNDVLLLCIDIQGKLARIVSYSEQCIQTSYKLIEGMNILNIPVIRTEQVPEKLGPTIAEIDELFSNNRAISKESFSCYLNQDFVRKLDNSNRRTIVVCGIEAHICVFQTVRDLLDNGYRAIVIKDAIASRTNENKEIAIDLMRDMGASIMSLEMILFDLLKGANGDEFKRISKLVK